MSRIVTIKEEQAVTKKKLLGILEIKNMAPEK